MNEYLAKVNRRTNLVAFAAIAVALVYAALAIFRGYLPALPGFIKGFHSGAFIGAELVAVWYLAKCIRARKNETELKKMYIEETDERTGLIIRNASTLGMNIAFIGLAAAAIISGFFSATVFFAITGCLFFILLVFYSLWAYYAKKI